MATPLKIGTRESPLALVQAEMVAHGLRQKHPALAAEGAIEIVPMTTSGDKIQDKTLAAAGGKGLFTKELEEALLAGTIDCAVHSMKDMPTVLPPGLAISCILPREDPREAFFSRHGGGIDDLPKGAVIGSSSLRRQAVLLSLRPDLRMTVLRGNVGTRLRKLEEGVADATILAVAGLKRLGLGHLIKHMLEPDIMLPAVAQGAVGVETRENDARVISLLAPLNCPISAMRLAGERAFLAIMDGSCRMPLGALMGVPDTHGYVSFDVMAAHGDGSNMRKAAYFKKITTISEAEELGREAGLALKK